MATTVAASPDAQPPMSAMARIIGVFFSPTQTFADIARKPSWLAPLLILAILGTGVGYFMNQKIDWGTFIRAKAEKNSRFAQLPEAQKERTLAPQVKFSRVIAYCAGVVFTAIFTLILALVYMLAFNLFAGAGVRFGQSFGIAAHAAMPSGLASVLIIVTLALKPYGEANPETMLASHPGAFLSPDSPAWMMSLLSSFELFWLWTIVLLAIGYAAVNPKKLTTGKAIGIVVGVWLAWVVLKVGGSYIFS
jgi:hypothetical protein